ncbi:cytochrome P450 [Dacryopinax primogenitus]|uniref:Cytochrome P450 n=1 Tax=Dacryopinax primogenitus (strain DJM 731) TaxID=1858805 RepID=M5FZG6_DACPD|nr:cytochrome P450 [Dacryopinax primogenitus]EJT98961.1 cytochrome P450 [Dacryopinax primogenitus]
MPFTLSFYHFLELGAVGAVLALYFLYRSQRLLPPGPNPIPLIGRTRFPIEHLEAFKSWAEKYPDIMTLRIRGQNVIIVNSLCAANDILEKRATSTSIRPQRPMCHDLVGYKNSTSQTNDMVQHKIYHFWAVEERELRKATLYMLNVPGDSTKALRRAMSAIVFYVAYGYNIETDGDAFVNRITDYMKVYQRLLRPADFLVDILPPLKHLPEGFPGAGFKRTASKWRKSKEDIHNVPFEQVKCDMASGNAMPSFTQHLLEEMPEQKGTNKYTEECIKLAASSIYTGGNDNNTSSVQSMMAAILLFPQVQDKAQAELDRVIGRDRLPSVKDLDDLPYCGAIVQEILRWQPPTPFALPHALDRDEEFQGYILPKGATIMANVWAMTRNPTSYPSPEEFIPERHLSTDENGNFKLEPTRNASPSGLAVVRVLALTWLKPLFSPE